MILPGITIINRRNRLPAARELGSIYLIERKWVVMNLANAKIVLISRNLY
jgi:hypothetical protein